MTIKIEDFGSYQGEPVRLFSLKNSKNTLVKISNYGCRIVSFLVEGDREIVLGYDDLDSYLGDKNFFGAVVGPYANRIEGGTYRLDNRVYRLEKNEAENSLHSGSRGFQNRLWNYRLLGDSLVLWLECQDGEDGFGGNRVFQVIYSLQEDNSLEIEYRARTSGPTIINLTNHVYFNLNEDHGQDILNHKISVAASYFTPIDRDFIPTGEIRPVEDFVDLREARLIAEILGTNREELRASSGLDHNYIIDGKAGELTYFASVENQDIRLRAYTSMPGVQVYTGNNIGGANRGRDNMRYKKHSGLCLETQFFPNSINTPGFSNTVLGEGRIFKSKTIYRPEKI